MLDTLRELPNPFDFANPVSDERRFFGRSTETADVIYYLNHAKTTSNPIHLAFVGARAAGKTSFLNMTELEAKRRDFCTVRINLNEGDVASDLHFFRKLFHSIAMAAFSAGVFGGKTGVSFFSYLDLIATGDVADREQIPFPSAFFIARGLKTGNTNVIIPDDMLTDDLVSISSALQKPVIVLIDECNVLSANRIILEKLRNIFMNIRGYMLVFAATGDFFPTMDEVFSPIMRQFKRIDIGAFKTDDDVRECVRKPLLDLGLTERDVNDLVQPVFVREVNAITGRRPYEIQLICHTLFRRCQERVARRFTLDLRTLESIQDLIATGQNISERPAIKAARSLNRRMFSALSSVTNCEEKLDAAGWWRLEYLFHGTLRWTQADFFSAIDHLIGKGLLSSDDEGLRFSGDEFDKIYIKYYSRIKQSLVRFSQQPLEAYILRTFSEVYSEFTDIIPLTGLATAEYASDVEGMLDFLSDNPTVDPTSVTITPVFEDLLTNIIELDSGRTVRLFEIYYRSDMGAGQFWFVWPHPEHASGLKKLTRRLEDLTRRGAEVTFHVSAKWYDLTVPTIETIVQKIVSLNHEQFSTRMGRVFIDLVHAFYVRRKDKERARTTAAGVLAITNSRLHSESNNVGYLYMDYGDYEEANRWFEAAAQYAAGEMEQILQYNVAVLHCLQGNYAAARSAFSIVENLRTVDVSCVHRIFVSDDTLRHEEIETPPSLVELSREAISALDAIAV